MRFRWPVTSGWRCNGTVPYDYWNADTESVFAIITAQTEVHSAKGRCDVLAKTADHIYAIELKLNGSAQEALNQIEAKSYLQPYTSDPRKKTAIGISFSSEKRMVVEYLVDSPESGDRNTASIKGSTT